MRLAAGLAVALGLLVGAAGPAAAGGLGAMLNEMKAGDSGCRLVFAFSNRTGERFGAFGMNLAVLDGDDRPIQHVPARTRGLPAGVITATSFVADGVACSRIAAIRLDGIFACEAGADAPACDAVTTVSSRAEVPLRR